MLAEKQTIHESSHVPVLKIEQAKDKLFLEQKDRQFKMMLEQWDSHPSPEWRFKVFAEAEKWKDRLESAKLLLAIKERAI